MDIISLGKVSQIYSCSDNLALTRHLVSYPPMEEFSYKLRYLERDLAELSDDMYWRKILNPLKKLRFGLSASPSTLTYKRNRIQEIINEIDHNLQICASIFGKRLYDATQSLLGVLEQIMIDPENPLFEKLEEVTLACDHDAVVWVTKESRFIRDIEDLLEERSHINAQPVHFTELLGYSCYETAIVIGPPRWFPDSVFLAPRASNMHIVQYSWIQDSWKPAKSFVNPVKASQVNYREEKPSTKSIFAETDRFLSEDILLAVSASSVRSATSSQYDDVDEYEQVKAKCVVLEGDWAIFIENEKDSILIIDLDDEDGDGERLRRIAADAIKPGYFILVRTGGGGDYILPIADRVLGKLAVRARRYQVHWKTLLRQEVTNRGRSQVVHALEHLGSEIANPVNLSNWMHPRSIRPNDYKDFQAIMKLIGLQESAKDYWEMMRRIDGAHRSAGFRIRKMLLAQVEHIDVSSLQRYGQMEFRISEDDEASLTAYRVETVLSELFEIPYGQLGVPFRVDS